MPVIDSYVQPSESDSRNMAIHPDRLVPFAVPVPLIVEMVAEIILGGKTTISSAIGRARADPLGQDWARFISKITETVRRTFHVLLGGVLTKNHLRRSLIERNL